MAGRRTVGNVLGLAVLSYLTQGPMHPYELSRTMRANGDERSVKFTHGSVYMVIEQLERAGFVAEHGTSREGQRPERTVYTLTEAGRGELRSWMRDLVAEPRKEFPHFVTALSLIGALPPAEAVGLLTERLGGLATLRAEARAVIDRATADGVHPLFLVEEEYRIAQLDADDAFTRGFIARITDPEQGWATAWQAFHDARDAGHPSHPSTESTSGGDNG
jgi:DNA-binding PadR family transcriptional regulator